ncbi:MAG: hypothetical protein KDD62_13860 [Bdellovibrionales bacterium]|nr:hypothetical protein [Bdellovibrionales bacterium]
MQKETLEPLVVADLVPHAAPMVLIDEALEVTDSSALCSLTVGSGLVPRIGNSMVPTWVAIEYMAQAIAVCAGAKQTPEQSKQIGFLMGIRNGEFGKRRLLLGNVVHVAVQLVYDDGAMAQFQGRVFDPETSYQYAAALLSVFRPNLSER